MHPDMKPGDAVATVAQPIAKAFDWAFGTDLSNCAGCKKMQANLNAGMPLHLAIYDRFFSKHKQGVAQMQFVITKQIAVEAETPEEAVQKITEGNTISLSVNPRPQPPQPAVRPGQPPNR